MAVLTVYADAADGEIDSYGDDIGGGGYAGARAGTAYSGSVQASPTSGQAAVGQNRTIENTGDPDFIDYNAYTVMEAFLSFDTSSIGDTDTVSAATLTVTSLSDNSTQDFTMQARLRDWGATLAAADYVAGASLSALTLLATYASSSGFTANTAYGLTDVALPANINKTGSTRMLLHSDRTSGNNTPSGAEYLTFYSADAIGTTNDPKLVVTYTASGGGTTITPAGFSVAWTGSAPTVTATDNKAVTPAGFSVAWTGSAPTVTATDNKAATPAGFSVAWTGSVPTVSVADASKVVLPDGFAVVWAGAVPALRMEDDGGKKKRRRRTTMVEHQPDDEACLMLLAAYIAA